MGIGKRNPGKKVWSFLLECKKILKKKNKIKYDMNWNVYSNNIIHSDLSYH